MSQAPHVVRGARWGLRLGPPPPLEDTLWEALARLALRTLHGGDRRDAWPSSTTSGGRRWTASRARSQAAREGRVGSRRVRRRSGAGPAHGPEDPRAPVPGPATSTCGRTRRREALAKLPPYFKKDGVVTAGNASGIGDGAAALVLASEALRRGAGASSRSDGWWPGAWPVWTPRSWASGRCPRRGGRWRGPGSRWTTWTWSRSTRPSPPSTSPSSGSSGSTASAPTWTAAPWPSATRSARAAPGSPLHLLHALRRRGGRYGLGAACIGGGQGIAVDRGGVPA